MEKTINYNRLENITYSFDRLDILRALMDQFKIKDPHDGKLEFDIWDETGMSGKVGAEIIVRYKGKDQELDALDLLAVQDCTCTLMQQSGNDPTECTSCIARSELNNMADARQYNVRWAKELLE